MRITVVCPHFEDTGGVREVVARVARADAISPAIRALMPGHCCNAKLRNAGSTRANSGSASSLRRWVASASARSKCAGELSGVALSA